MDHEARCAELYAIGNEPKDVPDGLMVVGGATCTLCKNTMRNNNYMCATQDGTPITWLNVEAEDGLYKMYSVPGIYYDETLKRTIAGGEPMGGTPAFFIVENGEVKRPKLASGEQPEGALEALVAKAKTV